MIWLLLILIYLLVSNIAVVVKLYRSTLRYFSPIKGYAASIALIIGLLAVDYVVFSFAYKKIEDSKLLNEKPAKEVRFVGASLRR